MIQNKSDSCFNCGYSLDNDENYCPNCGQKNTDLNISLGEILKEFAGDYFTFDSKLFNTIGPLIIRPGKVPKEFIDGKRNTHIQPLRIFIFLSFITFFLWGLSFQSEQDESLDPDELVGNVNNNASFIDSLNNTTPINIKLTDDSNAVDTSVSPFFTYMLDKENSPQEIVDSLAKDNNEITKKLFLQGLRMYQAEKGTVKKYLMGNISLVLLLLQPIFAMLLKLFYIRRKSFFYIEHLVFSLYFHAFILLLTILLFFLSLYVDVDILIFLLAFLSYLYFILASKVFYSQSWGKTFLKGSLISFIYLNLMFPASILTYLLLSLYFY